MRSSYLSSHAVLKELEEIADLTRKTRTSRRDGHVSNLDRFFWLTGLQRDGALYLHPSCELQGDADAQFWICNLVLRGGGTLGLAHVGFVTGLEHAGIRFAGLAGASAGAIVALGIAAARGGELLSSVTERIVDSTATAPLDWFIDGPRPVRMLIKHVLLGRKFYAPAMWRGLYRAVLRVLRQRGLNHGDAFEQWMEEVMVTFGVPTVADLEARLAEVHDTLAAAESRLKDDFPALLADGRRVITDPDLSATQANKASRIMKLITSAMPIGMKFELPGHLDYLDVDRRSLSPAKMVRMSMAIPIFFDPVRMPVDRAAWRSSPDLEALKDLVDNEKRTPQLDELSELTFIDGGVFSNLPSDSFESTLPDLPTILAPLVSAPDPEKFARDSRVSSVLKDAKACVDAARLHLVHDWSISTATEFSRSSLSASARQAAPGCWIAATPIRAVRRRSPRF